MTDEQFRIAVQNDVKTWIFTYMAQNKIPAACIEDAINKCLVEIKDRVMQEFIAAASKPADKPQVEKEEEESGEQENN